MGQVLGEDELSVRLTGPARTTGVSVSDGVVTLSLEADVAVELSALSRLWVKAFNLDSDVLGDLDDESGTGSGSGE